jgi:hypothetical protein
MDLAVYRAGFDAHRRRLWFVSRCVEHLTCPTVPPVSILRAAGRRLRPAAVARQA